MTTPTESNGAARDRREEMDEALPTGVVAWGLFAYLAGEGWVLQYPVRFLQEDAERDKRFYQPGTRLQVAPLIVGSATGA